MRRQIIALSGDFYQAQADICAAAAESAEARFKRSEAEAAKSPPNT